MENKENFKEKKPLLIVVVVLSILLALVCSYLIYDVYFAKNDVNTTENTDNNTADETKNEEETAEEEFTNLNEYIAKTYSVDIKDYYGKYVSNKDSNSYFEFNDKSWKIVYKSCGTYSTYNSVPDGETKNADFEYVLSPSTVAVVFSSADQAFADTNIQISQFVFVANKGTSKFTFIEPVEIKCGGTNETFDLGTFTKE